MIDGVKVKNLVVHEDVADAPQADVKLGYLLEILRADEEIFSIFGQSTMTVAYPGTIKGFHVHERQDDLWFVATGQALVVLHDLRPESPTFRETQTLHAGAGDCKLILIPVGVAHGYKVLSEEPVILFYHTTVPYDANNPDERRLTLDDPEINFNWNQHG